MIEEKEKRINELMKAFGLTRDNAELAYLQEVGEVEGDLEEVDDDGE